MIIESILSLVFGLINLLVGIIPSFDISTLTPAFSLLSSIWSIAVYFMGSTVWLLFVGTIVFWITFDLTVRIVKFLYRKIPGIT